MKKKETHTETEDDDTLRILLGNKYYRQRKDISFLYISMCIYMY